MARIMALWGTIKQRDRTDPEREKHIFTEEKSKKSQYFEPYSQFPLLLPKMPLDIGTRSATIEGV